MVLCAMADKKNIVKPKSYGLSSSYPLVNVYIAIENCHLKWIYLIYPLKMVIFHSYVAVYQRVSTLNVLQCPTIGKMMSNCTRCFVWVGYTVFQDKPTRRGVKWFGRIEVLKPSFLEGQWFWAIATMVSRCSLASGSQMAFNYSKFRSISFLSPQFRLSSSMTFFDQVLFLGAFQQVVSSLSTCEVHITLDTWQSMGPQLDLSQYNWGTLLEGWWNPYDLNAPNP